MSFEEYKTELGTHTFDPLNEHAGKFIPRDENVARYVLKRALGEKISLQQVIDDANGTIPDNITLGE